MKQILILLVTLFAFACSQPKEQQQTTLQQALAKLSSPVQTFTINPAITNTITTSSGIKIIIPAGSIFNPDGTTPGDSITINIREATTKSEMILNSISTTTTDGRILESLGMFNIEAISNNQQLSIKDSSSLQALFPNRIQGVTESIPSDPQTFYGVESNGIIKWETDSMSLEDLTETSDVYPINFDRLGWINCDRFIYRTNTDSLTITTTKDHTFAAYIVLKEINSVTEDWSDNEGSILIPALPRELEATILLIDRKDGQYYLAIHEFITGTIDSIHLEMKKISEQELLQQIKKLDSSN